jgi:hypothetical protein
MPTATRTFLERVSAIPVLRVDREKSTIYGVKVLGFTSANGREYTRQAVMEAADLYEGVPVNTDHPGRPEEPRSVRDRIGKLVNVRFVENEGLYADLEYLASHPFAAQLIEAAESMPDAFGLSHNARGDGEDDRQTGKFIVNRIVEVRHVDIVADPATTKSLSEGKQMPAAKKSSLANRKRKILEAYEDGDKEDEDKKKKSENTQEGESSTVEASICEIIDGEGDSTSKARKIAALMQAKGEQDGDKEPEVKEADEDGEDKDDDEEKKKPMEGKASRKVLDELRELREQLELRDKAEAIRNAAEKRGVKLDKKLMESLLDLQAMSRVEAILDTVAKANARPKSGVYSPESKPLTESKIPESGDNLARFLRS